MREVENSNYSLHQYLLLYIQETCNMIKHLHSLNKLIVLQWIPLHCGLYGNETADILGKKGTQIKTKPVNTLPFE
jgi:Ribonuclease HI